ncbi:MmcQ/YjbR family DNA-binding protein [Rhodococcus sp. IEGM 1354]|uniref:MmcQ/YjbR family DNA-binding protein n=1 Tax=Rhodococcus sp. IEGM 1354 TaxID=3047088 RepID=UPI0024B7A412|nr:MmcQ/YjbR family DNA-binding protein [Rhodococcus sp. IEGM 1354]MDI9929202.1 MmcQ/YjbR family DNA-binding protein [Rhodococcus sp. IEGM 1354]
MNWEPEVRQMCLALPETYEEQAWVGTRWRVRGRTFAHILDIVDGTPPAFATAAGTDGPAHVLVFRSSGTELDALSKRDGFFAPSWGPEIIGMLLDESVDRTELGELITESYCTRAPKKLVALLRRPE